MKHTNKQNMVTILKSMVTSTVILLAACASEPEVEPLAKCDYKTHMSVNEQTRDFIWRDQDHQTFSYNWRESSLVEISNRYLYLERKNLQDAVNAKNEITWLQQKLTNLQSINTNLLNNISDQSCDNSQNTRTPTQLEEQNLGVKYIQDGLPEILADIANKKSQIVAALDSKKS
ncbi:hypothetical protein AADZ86_09895 [Colwelliaceae bacterium BS250]